MGFVNDIEYKYGLQSRYDSLLEYDNDILYWCTDTKKLYRGEVDFTEAVRFASDHTALLSPARNVMYIEDSGDGWVYVKNAQTSADEWRQVIFADKGSGVTIVQTIDESSTDDVVPSAKAVYELFKTIDVGDLDMSEYVKREELAELYATKDEVKTLEQNVSVATTWSEM